MDLPRRTGSLRRGRERYPGHARVDEHARREPLTNLSRNVRAPVTTISSAPRPGPSAGKRSRRPRSAFQSEIVCAVAVGGRHTPLDDRHLPGPPCRPVASTRSPCVDSTWTPSVRRQRAESAGGASTSPGTLDRQSRARDAERLEDGSTIHVATPVCAPTGIVQPRTLRSPSATIGACRGGPAMSLVGRRLPYARLLQRRVWAPAWWRCSRPVRLDTASHLRSGSVGGAWREAHGRTVDGYAARARPVHVPPGASPVGDDDASRAPSER